MISLNSQHKNLKIGVVGVGAIGSAVCKALQDGIAGMVLHGIHDPFHDGPYKNLHSGLNNLVQEADLIIECLPPKEAQNLARTCLDAQKDMVMISACALLTAPDLLESARKSSSRIIVPSGALSGIDGVLALKHLGIKAASIASTKKPKAYDGAPFIQDNAIDLNAIDSRTQIFKGNALDAARGFPANLNVAATLSLAGIGAEDTMVEIWADPNIAGNQHEITVEGEFSTITSRIQNTPDPSNPKSSMLAAQSIVATLHNMTGNLIVV